MLKKKNRLQKKKEIDEVFRKGETRKSGFYVIKIKNNDLKDWCFGFIISQKVSKKASVRNRIKRRLRGLAAGMLGKSTTAKTGKDILVIVKPGAEKDDFQETGEALSAIFVAQ